MLILPFSKGSLVSISQRVEVVLWVGGYAINVPKREMGCMIIPKNGSEFCVAHWCNHILHNDIQHNDIQHNDI